MSSQRLNMDEEERQQCDYYGTFLTELSRPAAEALFWTFFLLVLCALFSTSWRYGRVMERIEHMKVGEPTRQLVIYRCFYTTLFFGLVCLFIIIFEALVLLSLQFCDQEPLASLYWSAWVVLQVGAVVAIFGITLHVRHMIKGRKHPPWALALGTPVLVVAGLGHYFQGKLKSKAKDYKTRSRSRSRKPRGRARDEPLSEVPTIRCESTDSAGRTELSEDEESPTINCDPSDDFNAKIIGYTREGHLIIRLAPKLSQELNERVNLQKSTITWNEPRQKHSMSKSRDGLRTSEPGTPGRSMHRSNSSVTFKGKDTEPTVQQMEIIRQDISDNISTDFEDFRKESNQFNCRDTWRYDTEKEIDHSMRLAKVADSLPYKADVKLGYPVDWKAPPRDDDKV